LEGETPPNSNVLFPVIFENEASTPLLKALRKDNRKGFRKLLMYMDFEKTYPPGDRFVETVMPSGDWKVKGSIMRHMDLWRQI
jgi:hypothetical protein